MKRLSSIILLAASLFVISAEAFKPSMDGRAVVADYGELPVGFFAKSASFLPGDTVIVTNPSTKISVEVMIFGSFDSSEGIAIILSPEAARELYITKGSNSIVQVTKKNSVYTETSILSRDVNKNGITEDPDIDPSLLIEDPVFDTPAVYEELPVFDPPVVAVVTEPEPVEQGKPVEEEPVEHAQPEVVPVVEMEPVEQIVSEKATVEPEQVPEKVNEYVEIKSESTPVETPEVAVTPKPEEESKPVVEIKTEEVKENEKRSDEEAVDGTESEPVIEPETPTKPETGVESESIKEPESEPVVQIVENEPLVKPETGLEAETIKDPEPEVETKPVVGPEPITPSVTNDNVGASAENKPVYPTGKTGIINREPKNTSDSVNPRDTKKDEPETSDPVVEPEPIVAETEDIPGYDSEMFMTEKDIELIDNEFVAVAQPVVEPEPEPVATIAEPVVTPEPVVEPEVVASEEAEEGEGSTAVLVPAKLNPPGPAVSEIGNTTPVSKPEKQNALVTSDSIYEGEDRVMQKYNYTGSELSSEIYEANPEDEKVASVSASEDKPEPEENIEPEENPYFADEPEVFIIPIVDLSEAEPEEENNVSETVEQTQPVVEPKKESVVEPEPVIIQPKPVVTQTEVTSTQTSVIKPVQQSDIKSIKAPDLDKGCYIQIATYSKMSNVKDVCDTYGNRYPIKVVEMTNGGWQVLVGSLSESEYTVVLERFRNYGFKDAFVKRIK